MNTIGKPFGVICCQRVDIDQRQIQFLRNFRNDLRCLVKIVSIDVKIHGFLAFYHIHSHWRHQIDLGGGSQVLIILHKIQKLRAELLRVPIGVFGIIGAHHNDVEITGFFLRGPIDAVFPVGGIRSGHHGLTAHSVIFHRDAVIQHLLQQRRIGFSVPGLHNAGAVGSAVTYASDHSAFRQRNHGRKRDLPLCAGDLIVDILGDGGIPHLVGVQTIRKPFRMICRKGM